MSLTTDLVVKDPLNNAWATDSDNCNLGGTRGGNGPKTNTTVEDHDITPITGLESTLPNNTVKSSSNDEDFPHIEYTPVKTN